MLDKLTTLSLLAQEDDHEAPNPVLPHVEEVVLGLVAFLLLLFVMRRFIAPRFEKLYAERTDAIEGGIQRAEAAQAEANRLLAQYREQLNQAKTEAAMIREDARADAESIRQDVLAQAREESERIIAAGREALAAERATLVRELRTYTGTLAVELASRIVGDALADEARRAGTVERFLAEIEQDAEREGGQPAGAGAR